MASRFIALLCVALSFLPVGASAEAGESNQILSAVLNETRRYTVSLPADYAWAQDRRYPVLYVLDGERNFMHSAATARFLAAGGDIPEMIVVGIDSTVRVRDYTQSDWPSMWIGGGGAKHFKRFLADELIPAIETDYRTDGMRILAGHSASGQFVLHTLATEPSLFQAYFAFEPSLDWDDRLPQRELGKSFEAARRLPAFLYLAQSDNRGQALKDHQQLVATLEEKSPPGFRWRSEDFPAEQHVTLPLVAQVNALRALYAGYRMPEGVLDAGLAGVERHFAAVSKTLGRPVAVPESALNELAYATLNAGETAHALALFARNAKAHPYSANAWDSLADGHAALNQWQEAASAAAQAAKLAAKSAHPSRDYFERHAKELADRLREADKE